MGQSSSNEKSSQHAPPIPPPAPQSLAFLALHKTGKSPHELVFGEKSSSHHQPQLDLDTFTSSLRILSGNNGDSPERLVSEFYNIVGPSTSMLLKMIAKCVGVGVGVGVPPPVSIIISSTPTTTLSEFLLFCETNFPLLYLVIAHNTKKALSLSLSLSPPLPPQS